MANSNRGQSDAEQRFLAREEQLLAEAIREAATGGGRPAREVIAEIRRSRQEANRRAQDDEAP